MNAIIDNDSVLVFEVASTTEMFAIQAWIERSFDRSKVLMRYAENPETGAMMKSDPYEEPMSLRVLRELKAGNLRLRE